MQKDKITKAILFGGFATITVAKIPKICDDATKIHNLTPVSAQALGRTLAITSILGSELKSELDSLSVNINGGGKLGNIVVAVDKDLNVRGLVGNPQCTETNLSVAVGKKGVLRLLRKTENSQTYVGTSEIVSGDIANDFASYFAKSEQQPSAVCAGAKFDENANCISCGAYLIRILPYCPDEYINILEKTSLNLTNFSDEIQNLSCEEFLQKYFGNFELEILNDYFPIYKCKCNKKNIEQILHTLDKQELLEIAKTDGQVEVQCHFCNKKYQFVEQDILSIFK